MPIVQPQLPFLNSDEVSRLLPMCDAIESMREAFTQLVLDEVTLPTRMQLVATSENGTALIMPCYSVKLKVFSLKMATVFLDNPRKSLPLVQSIVSLTCGVTGTPLATMDGASLTAIRTGAASGLATDMLASSEAKTVAIIGAGVQARTQLEAVCCVRTIVDARVFSRNIENAERFAQEMTLKLGIPVRSVKDSTEAVRGAEIICTATPSKTPVFDDVDVYEGAHINAAGSFSPDMIEIPASTVCRSRVFVDHVESALAESGDLIAPLRAGMVDKSHFASELGALALGTIRGRLTPREITLFKSVGIAVQDLFAAVRVLENAKSESREELVKVH